MQLPAKQKKTNHIFIRNYLLHVYEHIFQNLPSCFLSVPTGYKKRGEVWWQPSITHSQRVSPLTQPARRHILQRIICAHRRNRRTTTCERQASGSALAGSRSVICHWQQADPTNLQWYEAHIGNVADRKKHVGHSELFESQCGRVNVKKRANKRDNDIKCFRGQR